MQIILGLDEFYARIFTVLIGTSEIGMSVWIKTGIKSKLNAIVQIGIIALMNTLGFLLVPDLLLWGKMNSVFALILIAIIYYNEFVLNKEINQQS